ncbi:MAG TPA: winged helix-turn-helix domain-containing protein, partial [Mycobacterium sp.]|nr:winged helix-turn-helix domain-containing protein [Mycobacterium sp.]
MTITALSSRARERHVQARTRPIRLASTRPLASPRRLDTLRRSAHNTRVTFTFDVTLGGDANPHDAARLIDAIHQFAAEIGVRPTVASGDSDGASGSTPPLAVTATPDVAGTVVDTSTRSVRHQGKRVHFTRLEYELLLFLVEHPRQIHTRRQLLRHVWNHKYAGGPIGERTVDVHVRRLRAKLGAHLVTTVRGIGYRLPDSASIRVTPRLSHRKNSA